MAVSIAILSNCQHESMAVALRALLPEADIVSLDLNSVPDEPAARAQIAASLAARDHVISHDVAPDYGPLSTRALRASARQYHLLPVLHFGGFHPDCVAVRLDHTPLGGPAGGLHSRIVIAGMLAGLSAEQIIDLFNPLVFARLGYFAAIDEHSALLIEKFAAYAIDLVPLVAQWRASGCFMTSPHHPKMVVFLGLARVASAMMGLSPQADPPLTALRDPLAAFSTMPFLPELAARAGMQPEGVYRDTLPARPLSLPEFVHGSTKALARAPLTCLRAAQGVQDALARLDLRAAPRPQREGASGPRAFGLLTRHGTVIRIESASSLIVHEKLWPDRGDGTDLMLDPVEAPDGTVRADILGGLEIVPADRPGTVGIRRQGRAMQAEAGRLAVPFKGEGGGADETFLPLGAAAIARLRDILGRDWVQQGSARRASAARIRLRPGFILDFGIFAIDLAEMLPAPVPAGDEGGAGYVFDMRDGPIVIRPVAAAAGGREIALLADPQFRPPNEAGSIPEFRTSIEASWSLAAPEEILHPPLTAHDRDTAWVFDRCVWPGGLPSGLVQNQAALRRMPRKAVLLCPGLEGLLFDAGGVLSGDPAFAPARGQSLPDGLRQEDGVLLMAAAHLRAAPLIGEPVALCLSPGWGERDGWLIDVALRLHVMAPFLPRGARLLMPPGFAGEAAGRLALLDAVGLGQFPVLEAPAPLCRLADALWLDTAGLAATPAAVLADFRARIAALYPAGGREATRLYVKPGGTRSVAANDGFEGFLAAQGFTTVVPQELSPAARIALFRSAEMVIGVHGEDLANIVFCQPGTRIMEISPRGQFRPRYWMLAEKCGLIYGVLPCATDGGGFDSVVQMDVVRLRALFRVLRLTMEK